ncbi:MAG: phosphatase PAP2 family protein [Dehalococcoidia bacterium]
MVEGGRVDDAFRNADTLIALEQSLGIFWEKQAQAMIIGNNFLIDFFNWIYIWGHLPVVGILAIWVYFFRRPIFARYRNAFIISGMIGLCFFLLVPMAPPRFIVEAGFVDTITLHDKVYHALQAPGFVNQYAAMPSLHLGWNLLVGLAVFEAAKVWIWKAFGLFMPIPMLAGIIFTGNHYFLDAVAGVAVALVALWLATQLNRMFRGTPIHTVLV